MTRTNPRFVVPGYALAWLAAVASGCLPSVDDPPDSGETHHRADSDRAGYLSLQRALDAHRDEPLGERADELRAAGNTLFWLEFPGFSPTLHSHGDALTVEHTFGIGSDPYNFAASSTAITTAIPGGETVRYAIYARDEPAKSLGEAHFPAPKDAQRWWAHAVDDTTLYVVTTEVGKTTLHRHDPISAETRVVTVLESAGCEIGIFYDFGVEGDTMVFVESGRLWRLDLASNHCTFLGNETEITGTVDFRADGALYDAYDGPHFFDALTGETTALAEAIIESGYQINESYDRAHWWAYDVARWDRWAVYVARSGVFAYHLDERRVLPVLLEPLDEEVRISYRYPVVLTDGTLYVTALTSYNGSVGVDGPVHRVHLPDVLR